jgi:hypothetical protein
MEKEPVSIIALAVESDDIFALFGTSYKVLSVKYDGETMTLEAQALLGGQRTQTPVTIHCNEFTPLVVIRNRD